MHNINIATDLLQGVKSWMSFVVDNKNSVYVCKQITLLIGMHSTMQLMHPM